MEASFARWIAWLTSLTEEAVAEGSLPPSTDSTEVAYRLAALVEGLGSVVVRSLVTREQARNLLASALARELASTELPDMETRPRPTVPATGYLRRLAALTAEAVQGLDGLATTRTQADAIAVVRDLIDNAAGPPPETDGSSSLDGPRAPRATGHRR